LDQGADFLGSSSLMTVQISTSRSLTDEKNVPTFFDGNPIVYGNMYPEGQ
jgi:hypothetical protein